MKTLITVLLCLGLFSLTQRGAGAGDITIAYIERPPFYYTEDARVKGVLADLTNKIFDTAGISRSWQSFPPQRIISMLQNTKAGICSPGWFFKEDRLAYAQFTLPIYQNRPLSVLVKKDEKSRFESYDSLAALFSDSDMAMGTVATYRYSGYIDEQIKLYHPKQVKVYTSASQLAAMIILNRVNYIIIAPLEAKSLIHEAGLKPDRFALLTFPDIPPGNRRYLMCSRSVDAEIINALNAAIRQIIDPGIWQEPEAIPPKAP